MNVCYCGPTLDYSGYGEANRHEIASLDAAGVEVTVQALSYCLDTADFGEIGKLCEMLNNRPLDYRIKILHVTPDQYKKHVEPGKYHIGRLFWETSKLPQDFIKACEYVDEIWTGSHTNAEAIRDSGVNKPIFVCPQPTEVHRPTPIPYRLFENRSNPFVFYSIFEWSERKNPKALIQAYLEEFSEEEEVVLLVKSYSDNFQADRNQKVRSEIRRLRYKYGQGRAKVLLYKYLMDRGQIQRLHITGDCYVTAHRGEGWGIPIVEAMLHARPVITTKYNGVNDYLTNAEAYLLPYTMVNVDGMDRNPQWYASNQRWADVKVADIRKAMRYVFENQQEALIKASLGQKFVTEQFNFERVGQIMKERLEQIERKL